MDSPREALGADNSLGVVRIVSVGNIEAWRMVVPAGFSSAVIWIKDEPLALIRMGQDSC